MSPDLTLELLGHFARPKLPSWVKLFDGNLRLKFRWLGGLKPLCSSLIRNCWPDGFWLETWSASLLDYLLFCLVSTLFSVCLIFFPSSESPAIGSATYSATVSQPRIDLSALLINLFRHFSFAVKSSQRLLALLASSLFNAEDRFSTICKICWLNLNFILFPLCLNLKVSYIFAFLFDGCCNFFSIPSKCLAK